MLGSGINPESFKLDYSGMANAAATQAQGVANLGASIGGAISEVGDYFKKQAEDEKKVQKSLSVAKAIGDLIPGLKPTIQGSLNILNDKELPLSQRTAEADAIADILDLGINEVRNRQDVGLRERALGIQEAQFEAENAPPMPAPLTYKRATNVPYGGGFLDDLLIGSDGQYYDEARNLVADMGAFARGESPEIYSGYSTFSDDLGSIDTPPVIMPGENTAANIDYASGLGGSPQTASFPININVPTPAPFLDAGRINAGRIDAALDGGVLPPKEEIAGLERVLGIDANKRQEIQSRIRFDTGKTEEGKIMSQDEILKLIQQGFKVSGRPAENGGVFVTDVQSLAPQIGKEVVFNPDGTLTTRDIPLASGLNKAPTTSLKEGEVLVEDPNSPTGTKIVQIPSEAKEKAQNDFTAYISQVGDSYARLDKMGKAVSAGKANPLNYVFSTPAGQTMARMFGEEGQTLRDDINTMAPNIINVIRQSTQMGSKGMDSNAEREFYIKAMGDPTLPIEANIKALDALDKAYGKGNAIESIVKNYPDLAKKVNAYKLTPPKASASSIPRSEEIEAIRKKYLTPNAQ